MSIILSHFHHEKSACVHNKSLFVQYHIFVQKYGEKALTTDTDYFKIALTKEILGGTNHET